MHWLLTRPDGHNLWLTQQLQQLGHSVSVRPTLHIAPMPFAPQAIWQSLDAYQALLFTSVNAVTCFAQALWQQQLQWPKATYFAIGTTTANSLADYGHPAISPSQLHTTEAFLQLPQLASLSGSKLLLVSGEGGRGLLQPALQQRGVQVSRLDVYRRCWHPTFHWPDAQVDAVMVTSLASWQCLLDKAPIALQDCIVVAGSKRIANSVSQTARITLTADSPRDADMLAALTQWSEEIGA